MYSTLYQGHASRLKYILATAFSTLCFPNHIGSHTHWLLYPSISLFIFKATVSSYPFHHYTRSKGNSFHQFPTENGLKHIPLRTTYLLHSKRFQSAISNNHDVLLKPKLNAHTLDNNDRTKDKPYILDDESSKSISTSITSNECRAKNAFEALAQRNRTWKRLCHMVEMACVDNNEKKQKQHPKSIFEELQSKSDNKTITTIADIGCDHGLLSIALAMSNQFEKVIGVDVSDRALQNGAIANYKRVMDHYDSNEMKDIVIPLEFRQGDGLQPIENEEIDALCIAGMGVNTMIQILFQTNHDNSSSLLELTRIGCHHLFLQPTNSKPRNLIKLYDALQASGWILRGEQIEYLSSRWYLTVAFSRNDTEKNKNKSNDTTDMLLPGAYLHLDSSNEMNQIYLEYMNHHCNWLKMDESKKGFLCDEDKRWLTWIDSLK